MRNHRYKKIVCIILVLIFCFMSVTPALADYYFDPLSITASFMRILKAHPEYTEVHSARLEDAVNIFLDSSTYRTAAKNYPNYIALPYTEDKILLLLTKKPCTVYYEDDGSKLSEGAYVFGYFSVNGAGEIVEDDSGIFGYYYIINEDGSLYKSKFAGYRYYHTVIGDGHYYDDRMNASSQPVIYASNYEVKYANGHKIPIAGGGSSLPDNPDADISEADLDFACGVMSLLDLLMAVLIDGGHFTTDVYMTKSECAYLCNYMYGNCTESEREYIRQLGAIGSITQVSTNKVSPFLQKILGYLRNCSLMSGEAYNSSSYDARTKGIIYADKLKYNSLPATVNTKNGWYAWLVAGQYVLLQVTGDIPDNAISITSEQTRTENGVAYYRDYVTIQDSLKYSDYYGWGANKHFPISAEYGKEPHYYAVHVKPCYSILSGTKYKLKVPAMFSIANTVVVKESDHIPDAGRWNDDYSQTICFPLDNELIKNAPERLSGAGGGEVVEPEIPEQPGGEVDNPVFDNTPNDDKLPTDTEDQESVGILKLIYNKLSDIYFFLTNFLWDSVKGDSDNSGSGTEDNNSQGNSFFDVIGKVISGGFSVLRGLLDTILGVIKTFGLGILDAIGELPGLIINGLSALLVPSDGDMQNLWSHFNDGITKEFGVLNLDLSSIIGDEEVPGGIYAVSVMTVDNNTDSHNKAVPLPENVSFVNFQWFIVAVEYFRPFIRAFLILMLMLFTYNQILRLLGAAPISATGGQSEVKEVSRKG